VTYEHVPNAASNEVSLVPSLGQATDNFLGRIIEGLWIKLDRNAIRLGPVTLLSPGGAPTRLTFALIIVPKNTPSAGSPLAGSSAFVLSTVRTLLSLLSPTLQALLGVLFASGAFRALLLLCRHSVDIQRPISRKLGISARPSKEDALARREPHLL
jgi:hypothetical protein